MAALGILLAAGRAAGEELPSRADEPYRIVVALTVSDDPTFTRYFADSVRREVRDQLAHYFGSLAEVQVVEEHAILNRLAGTSLAELAELPPGLAGEASLDKLFLMAIDGDGGAYRVQWRQLDFEVGQAGPLRSRSTPDRQWLAKAIALAVKEDFAPVARVEAAEGDAKVRLVFHGAGRSPKLLASLEAGCVLQPFWVIRGKEGTLTRSPVPHTVLSIDPGQDPRTAAVVSGIASPWKRTPRVAGFQAIKLSTQSGRFRLRLVNAQTGAPVLACTVSASSRGFEGLTDRDRLPDPNPEGFVVGPRPFDNMAYVTIAQGKSAVFRFLLPITADWNEVEYQLPLEPMAQAKNEWHRQLRYRIQDVQVLQSTLDQAIREVNALNRDKQYEEALRKVKGAAELLKPMVQAATSAVEGLEAEARRLKLPPNALLAWTREQLQDVEHRREELGKLGEDLAAAMRDLDAGKRAQVLVRLAAQAESAGQIDDAIEKYGLALRERPDQPQVQEHLEGLREAWRIKSPEHQRARSFVRDKFARAGVDELPDLLPEAARALAALRGVDDYLTARQFLRAVGEHYRELADLTVLLAGRTGEADRQEAQKYVKVAEEFEQLRAQIKQYLDNRGKPAAAAPAPPPKPPAETKPPGAKPKPEAKPKPAEGKPPEGKPAEGKPAEGKPAEGKPAEKKPAEGTPVAPKDDEKGGKSKGPSPPPPIDIKEEEEKPLGK